MKNTDPYIECFEADFIAGPNTAFIKHNGAKPEENHLNNSVPAEVWTKVRRDRVVGEFPVARCKCCGKLISDEEMQELFPELGGCLSDSWGGDPEYCNCFEAVLRDGDCEMGGKYGPPMK